MASYLNRHYLKYFIYFQTKKVGEDILDLLNIKSAKVMKLFFVLKYATVVFVS